MTWPVHWNFVPKGKVSFCMNLLPRESALQGEQKLLANYDSNGTLHHFLSGYSVLIHTRGVHKKVVFASGAQIAIVSNI